MSDRPPVTVRDDADRNRFEAVVDGEVAGWIDYRLDGDTIDMHHTEVDDQWEGKGVASVLAGGALDQARSAGRKVVMSCPFVARYVEKNEQYADLVA
jgi:uncharacterized protein